MTSKVIQMLLCVGCKKYFHKRKSLDFNFLTKKQAEAKVAELAKKGQKLVLVGILDVPEGHRCSECKNEYERLYLLGGAPGYANWRNAERLSKDKRRMEDDDSNGALSNAKKLLED